MHLRIKMYLVNCCRQKNNWMKITFQIIFFFISFTILLAQAPNKNWQKVLEINDQYVFVDTSNIKQIENQISAIGLSVYKSPKSDIKSKQETYAVKTNVVFDTGSKKYTVIGNLYYDKQWKIIGENSAPGRSINSALFGSLIDTSKVMSAIYDKCVNYIAKNSNVVKENKANENEKNPTKKDVKPVKEKKDTVVVPKNTRESLTEKFIDKKLSEDSKSTVLDKPVQKQPINSDVSEKKGEYNLSADKNVRGTIFSDGKKYSFQLSSWKNKPQAEAEVKRLNNAGHNAFLVEAYLPNKGGNWYRVRIGYFDSADEADRYRRNMR